MNEFERGRGGTVKAAEPLASASSAGRLDVEGGDGVYLLLDPQTRHIRGTLVDLGDTREVFVAAGTAEPWRNAAERVAAA
ncbi:hypothetical protein [Actinomadura roseirufa]|uniref:hypothetical protein n=1 Tax=Actinomadura roseirufa TaxID=2094049 RepID=UPI0010411999|nr:hypothetical protein [Actinomadura roseirufa]